LGIAVRSQMACHLSPILTKGAMALPGDDAPA
jgi:hypothetical protein